MAFAVTKFMAYGVRSEGATRSHCEQVVELFVTGLNTDVLYDLSVTSGTFWTSATADAVYGTLASNARDVILNRIAGAISSLWRIDSQLFQTTYAKVLSGASGNQYVVSVVSSIPTIGFVSGSAPTAIALKIQWRLHDGIEPVIADLGGQV